MSHCGTSKVVSRNIKSSSNNAESSETISVCHTGSEKQYQHGETSSEISNSFFEQKTVPKRKRNVGNEKVSCVRIQPNLLGNMSGSVLVDLFETVFQSGVPNYRGCRIPLPYNKHNLTLWRKLLVNYSDKVICEFLEFGFPLDFDTSISLHTKERRNHKGAREYPQFIDRYLHRETEKCRIAGPFCWIRS